MVPPTANKILPPEGTFMARVINLIYLGTCKTIFKNEDGTDKYDYKVRITWELPTELHKFKEGDEEKPFIIHKEVTLSLGKKSNLRPLVEGIIGTSLSDEEAKKFDVDQILGSSCLVTIAYRTRESGKYAEVKSCSGLLKGVTCPPAVNPLKILSYEKWDEEYFTKLPNFLREKMSATREFKVMKGLNMGIEGEISSDDVPYS